MRILTKVAGAGYFRENLHLGCCSERVARLPCIGRGRTAQTSVLAVITCPHPVPTQGLGRWRRPGEGRATLLLRSQENCRNHRDAIGSPIRLLPSGNHNSIHQVVSDFLLEPV